VKTTSRDTHYLWRGKDLPALSEFVSAYLSSGDLDVLFASNIDTESVRFKILLELIMNDCLHNQNYIYYPNVERLDLVSSRTPSELLSHIVEEGFSEVMYIFDEMNRYLIYSNSRDSLSFWVVSQGTLTEQEVQEWDLEFQKHLETTGIGFGDEGKAYARRLLSELADANARNLRRFTPMLRLLQ
jgi:hypothetical protein